MQNIECQLCGSHTASVISSMNDLERRSNTKHQPSVSKHVYVDQLKPQPKVDLVRYIDEKELRKADFNTDDLL